MTQGSEDPVEALIDAIADADGGIVAEEHA